MSFENYVLEAVERVLNMDYSDDQLSQAVIDHAAFLAKLSVDQWGVEKYD